VNGKALAYIYARDTEVEAVKPNLDDGRRWSNHLLHRGRSESKGSDADGRALTTPNLFSATLMKLVQD
jgi:hypothetical protein